MSFQGKDQKTGETVLKKVFFPIPKVKIPVLTDNGETFVQWGKRHGEDPEVDVPITGWARLLSLKEGKWNRYRPQKVRIPALSWMEKATDKTSHWFEMEPDTYLLGVQVEQGDHQYVYVVTRPATDHFAQVHERMPFIIKVPALSPC